MRKAFTIIELLAVIGISALLLGILLPGLRRARMAARVVAVNAELRQLAIVIETYMAENQGLHPPTRTDCAMGWEDHQLPPELVEGRYLPAPSPQSGMSAGVEDRFNRKNTYRYWAVGPLYRNNRYVPDKKSQLWVPDGFPDRDNEEGRWHSDPFTSPVTWVVFSNGPRFDWWAMKQARYPVPRTTWYDPARGSGVIVRMRLANGRNVGSFEGKIR